MAMDPVIRATFLAHIRKFPKQDACPVCKTKHWLLSGPAGIPRIDGDETGASFGDQIAPLILARCKTCSYIRMFAWTPIKDQADQVEPDKAADNG